VNPDFTVVIVQMILDEIVLHVYTDIFLHGLTVFFLELVGELQQNENKDRFYMANQLGKCKNNIHAGTDAVIIIYVHVFLEQTRKMVY